MVFAGLGCALLGSRREASTGFRERGQIKMSCSGPGELVLKLPGSGGKESTYASEHSTFDVPAGKCRLWYYTCSRKDAQGLEWFARSGLSSRDDEVFRLAAGEVKQVKAGPPFKAVVKVHKGADRQVVLDLKLTGAGGDAYRIMCKRQRAPDPTFAITDKTGRKVLSGSFRYG